jgi:hypothetical protein
MINRKRESFETYPTQQICEAEIGVDLQGEIISKKKMAGQANPHFVGGRTFG